MKPSELGEDDESLEGSLFLEVAFLAIDMFLAGVGIVSTCLLGVVSCSHLYSLLISEGLLRLFPTIVFGDSTVGGTCIVGICPGRRGINCGLD